MNRGEVGDLHYGSVSHTSSVRTPSPTPSVEHFTSPIITLSLSRASFYDPPMTRHAGKAAKAALRIIFWTLVLFLALLSGGALLVVLSKWIVSVSDRLILIGGVLGSLWLLFAIFTLFFFRDPAPVDPADPKAIVAPAFGKVDVIEETEELEFLKGPCRRISIFLSVFDVHVQRAPVSGDVVHLHHRPGKYLSATKTHSAEHNESVLLGFELTAPAPGRMALRLIAGLIARRIIPWVAPGDSVARGERLSLIQFGSRCDLYLPLDATLQVQLGDRVKAGESVVASFP